jgi:hypothetical protein
MIRINNVEYRVATGFNTTYTIDKSLDFGSFVIPITDREEPFDMFSEIEITRDDNTVEYFLLSGDVVEISSYNPIRYSHRVEFVEYTKKLEFYTISSATFTQPTDGTTRYNIDDVLQRLVNISVFETATRHTAAKPCLLDSSIAAKLGSIKAPEFFFNNITLRAALDNVLGAIPGIARLERINGVDILFVDYFDQTKAIANINEGVGHTSQQIIQDYATTLVGDVSNALRATQGIESVSVYPNNNGWASVSSPLGVGVLDNDRVVFDFKEDIYDLVKLEIFAQIRVAYRDANNNQQEETRVFERDITQYVFTKNQFDNALGANWNYTTDITQQNAIFYQTGNRVIEGLGTNWVTGIFTQNVNKRRAIENIIATEIVADGDFPNGVIWVEIRNASNQNDLTNLLFRTIFIPVEKSNRVEVERDDITYFTKEAKTYFKQSATLINLNHYVNSMKSDLQRIGEERFTVMILHSSFADVFDLGDYLTDGHIIMTRTITQEKDYIMANYEFSRNYQQINDFISINKAKDEFALIGEDKAVDRFVVYKDYVVLSEVADALPPLTNDTQHLLTSNGINAYMNTFTQTGTPNTIEATVWNPDPAITLLNGVNGSGIGASLVLSSGFQHQNFAGFQIIPNNADDGGFIQSPVSYAFQGLLPNFEIQFINQFSGPQLTFQQELNRSRVLPLLARTDYTSLIKTNDTGPFMLFKDPGERLNLTYQLQAVSHPNSVNTFVIGNYFHDYNALVHPAFETLKVYGNADRYNRSDKETILANSVDLGTLNCSVIGSLPNSPTLNILNSVVGYNSYAVADENGRLLFAVNRKLNGLIPTTIAFNFNHRRPNLNKL